jgi:hypothetical protein
MELMMGRKDASRYHLNQEIKFLHIKKQNLNKQFHPAPGSKRSLNCIKCTNADVRLRTPDDGQKGCPKHVES